MQRSIATALAAALALGAVTLAAEPAAAMPTAGVSALETAAPAAGVEDVRFFRHRGFGFRRGYGFRRHYGFRRGYGYRRGFGYRRGLPGHPIRRILRAL